MLGNFGPMKDLNAYLPVCIGHIPCAHRDTSVGGKGMPAEGLDSLSVKVVSAPIILHCSCWSRKQKVKVEHKSKWSNVSIPRKCVTF